MHFWQPWNLSPDPNSQGFLSNPAAQAPQIVPKPSHEVSSGVASQPSADVKSIGRRELPEVIVSLEGFIWDFDKFQCAANLGCKF